MIFTQSKSLTHDEETIFVEACKSNTQGAFLLLCLYQGLRLGEALALTPSDVDFDKKVIHITKAINGEDKLSLPKTANSVRDIPLFNKTIEVLKELPQNCERYFKYGRKIYQQSIMRMCKKINLPNVSMHTLRHTFATRCMEAGISVKVVQRWLGHSTLDMTLNVYTHVNSDFEQKEIEKFDTYFDT